MNAVTSVEQSQKLHYADVKKRLYDSSAGKAAKVFNEKIAVLELQIEQVRQQRDKYADDLRTLALDVSDLQAVVVAQASKICDLEGFQAELGDKPVKVKPKDIIADVLRDFPGITVSEIMSCRRSRHIVAARHACVKAVYERRPDLSSTRIGEVFNRDHTSILAALGRLSGKRK